LSQVSDPRTVDPDRAHFAAEPLDVTGNQLVVRGHWFGVRGRRFVRPTLIFIARSDGHERRALADLEHKPWATEDGEPWVASFPLEEDISDFERIELSVAPDITVELPVPARGGRRPRAAPDVTPAPAPAPAPAAAPAPAPEAHAPRERSDRPRPRASGDLAQDNARLKARFEAARQAHERERTRREAAEQALEEERASSLQLRSDLGRARAQLDLATTAQRELAAASAELEQTRSHARDAGEMLDQARERARHTGRELESARADSQTAGRQLQDLERELRDARTIAEQAQRRLQHANRALEQERAETQRLRHELSEAAMPESEPARSHHQHHALRTHEPDWTEATHRSTRPLNPQLRSRGDPVIRAIAIVVVLAVLVAVVLVIRTTV
jgi:hypothetical protein